MHNRSTPYSHTHASSLVRRLFSLSPAVLLLGCITSPGTVSAEELPDKESLRSAVHATVQETLAASTTPSESPSIQDPPPVDTSTDTSEGDTGDESDSEQKQQQLAHPLPQPDALQSSPENTGESTAKQIHQNTHNSEETEEAGKSETTSVAESSAVVSQATTAKASTGQNQANRNISIGGNAGSISTGAASVHAQSEVAANNSAVSGSNSPSTTATQSTKHGALDSSEHSQNGQNSVISSNGAVIHQHAQLTADTGNNTAERNISMGGTAGLIQTGDATTSALFLVSANQGIGIYGGPPQSHSTAGSGASVHINTSVDPRYQMSKYRSEKSSASATNSASVSQTCGTASAASVSACTVSTGHNTANRNIARGGNAGHITTGDAYLGVLQSTLVNKSELQNTSQQSSFGVDNHAVVNQSVYALATTGHNTADRNISFGGNAGVIQTGDAVVVISQSVVANNTKVVATSPAAAQIDDDLETSPPVDADTDPIEHPHPEINPPVLPHNPTPNQPTSGSEVGSPSVVTTVVSFQVLPPLVYQESPGYHYLEQSRASDDERNFFSVLGQAFNSTAHAATQDSNFDPCIIPGTSAQSTGISLPQNVLGTWVGTLFAMLAAVVLTYLVRPLQGSIK